MIVQGMGMDTTSPDMLYIVKESVSNMQSRASERSPR